MASEIVPAEEEEVIRLGGVYGLTVRRAYAAGGEATFETSGGSVRATVYKAREPDVRLENIAVYLVQQLREDWRPGQPYVFVERYVLMVDDPYWGRRIQPAAFQAAPFEQIFVMGYRLKGRILRNGQPVEGANVSLEGLVVEEKGEAVFWDSEEYNELVWSDTLETYVEGPNVYAPLRTEAEGRFEFIAPKGAGAIYQRAQDRRDDTEETAQEPLPWRLERVSGVYRGRRADLQENVEAEINIESGRLEIAAEPGIWLRVGTLDEPGESRLVPESGLVVLEGLPGGEHSIVPFRLNAYGGWDSCWGGPRKIVVVREGETTSVALEALEYYDPGGDMIAGRVYERAGVPAVGLPIYVINYETGELGGPIAETDEGGYWEATIPPEGLGGDPWIYDAHWGCVPVLGFPYSDVVLGARAYASWREEYQAEAWRKGPYGHANFPYVPGAVWIEDNVTGERFETTESAYGGWITQETLPKFRFIGDVEELLNEGPQPREYSVHTEGELLLGAFVLRSQNFEDYETLPGQFRAAGFYPEAKFLLGGKLAGSVVEGDREFFGLSLPEAYRLGLEFGRHQWLTRLIVEDGERRWACFADWLCPYCGGPTWRDPDAGGFVRGYCLQCAIKFGDGMAMDGRTYFRTPTLRPGA